MIFKRKDEIGVVKKFDSSVLITVSADLNGYLYDLEKLTHTKLISRVKENRYPVR